MQKNELAKFNLPGAPGVYIFKQGRRILYVGKATNLHDRVRSYFDDDLIATRGSRIVDMVTKADRLAHETIPTVLEALVREAVLIKKYHPPANVEGKDDSTFLYAVITRETIPRMLTLRGRDIDFTTKSTHKGQKLKAIFGPFPSSVQLRIAMRLIQRIFPFFDTSQPVAADGTHHQARLEFNKQIKQYPRAFNVKEYRQTMRKIALFFSGHAKQLRMTLEKEMHFAAREERFEDAARIRHQLFALDHVQDVSLIKDENLPSANPRLRIEAYDTAHLSGTNAIGVMTVFDQGTPVRKEYRMFRIRGINKSDDIASLKEILLRRLAHTEWPLPKVVVVDGNRVHKRVAEVLLAEAGVSIPVVAVVKDNRHRPREVIGVRHSGITEIDAVLANSEAHRFSLLHHRRARERNMRLK